jgi:hypothetical protein
VPVFALAVMNFIWFTIHYQFALTNLPAETPLKNNHG